MVVGDRLLFIVRISPFKVVELDIKTWRCTLVFEEALHFQNFGVHPNAIRGGSNMLQLSESLYLGIVHKVHHAHNSDGLYHHNFILVRSTRSSYKIEWISEDFR